jgi:hypothetical protein
MFEKYDNISSDYIPDNTSPKEVPLDDTPSGLPRRCYNIKNEFVGFSWIRGEKFEFSLKYEDVPEIKDISVEIYDYQQNHLKSFKEIKNNSVVITVDESLNEILKSGIYYLKLMATDNNSTRILDEYSLIIN